MYVLANKPIGGLWDSSTFLMILEAFSVDYRLALSLQFSPSSLNNPYTRLHWKIHIHFSGYLLSIHFLRECKKSVAFNSCRTWASNLGFISKFLCKMRPLTFLLFLPSPSSCPCVCFFIHPTNDLLVFFLFDLWKHVKILLCTYK